MKKAVRKGGKRLLVTAIVIPILFLCFYFIVRKEKRKQLESWKALNQQEETDIIKGQIDNIYTEKKRYFQQLFLWKTTIHVIDGNQKYTIIYEKPADKKEATLRLSKRDYVACYGSWYQNVFQANRIEKL